MVRTLGLQPGDKLVAELIDDRIVLLPRPDSWAEYMIGSLEGVYGSTKEEVDRYIAEVRYGSDGYGLSDALDGDPDLRAVYDATSSVEPRALAAIREESGVYRTDEKLDELAELDAVGRVDAADAGSEAQYRRLR
jgi:hypothetical protein